MAALLFTNQPVHTEGSKSLKGHVRPILEQPQLGGMAATLTTNQPVHTEGSKVMLSLFLNSHS